LWSRRGQAGEGAKRANARYLLVVSAVAATRLMDISEGDALAEGVLVFCPPEALTDGLATPLEARLAAAYEFQLQQFGPNRARAWRAGDVHAEVTARDGRATARHNFALLFESINGRGSWHRNPWVWRYTFRKGEQLK
jgi:hypothetical protein